MSSQFDRVAWAYDLFMCYGRYFNPERILRVLRLSGDEVIADLGGGTGHYAAALSPHCREVTVIDESEGMLSRVPRIENVKTLKVDIHATGLPDEHFDVALLIDVIHHVCSQEEALNEAHRILRPGGRFLVMDFDARNIRTRLLRIFELMIFGHVLYFTPPEMIEMLTDAGFVDVRCEDCSWNYIIAGAKK